MKVTEQESLFKPDRSQRIYFDTSIFNKIMHDPDIENITRIIREKNLAILPSLVNLCEMLLTSDEETRKKLINLYNMLRNGIKPLKPDDLLLEATVEAVAKGEKEYDASYDIEISEHNRNACRQLRKDAGDGLRKEFIIARDQVQKAEKENGLTSVEKVFAFIDSDSGYQLLRNIFDSFCKIKGINKSIPEDVIQYIIKATELPWKYHLESILLYFYRTVFSREEHGRRKNPGHFDLMQCIYLFWPSIFVIQDDSFYGFVKQLVTLRNYDIEIFNYEEFKAFLKIP